MITNFSFSRKELIVASKFSTVLALCALTSASIYPLTAAPRQIKISPDGTTSTDSRQESPGKGKGAGRSGGWNKDIAPDGGTTDGGTNGGESTDGGSGTGGTDTGSGGGDTNDGGGVTTDLPPLDLSDMALWNWSGTWHASNWDNAWSSIPYRYDHVQQDAAGNTYFVFDAKGAPELKAQNGHPYSTKAYYEVDVTLPQMRSGMVVAPLWLWHDKTRDEVDFEFVAG